MALTSFTSGLIADVGISFGDEGKGRLISEIVDELRQNTGDPAPVEVVFKVNGGANSGHTAGGLKLNLLPAGVVEEQVPVLGIGSGVVADPRKFLWESRPLEKRGYSIFNRLLIDEKTMVSDPGHRLLDLAWEDYRQRILGEEPRGSTGRGITPAYIDETGQWQIFYGDFLGPKDVFVRKLRQRLERAVLTIRHVCQVRTETWDGFFDVLTTAETRANAESIDTGVFRKDEFSFVRFRGKEPYALDLDGIIEACWEAGTALAPYIGDLRERILDARRRGKYIIGEFGQSFWLDKRRGFTPNVTASHSFTPEFFESSGLPLQPVHTFGVAKAYDTKVGTHVFHTEIPATHPLGRLLQKLEFGTSTGRQRNVGWFDAVEKGDALRYGGFQDLMINKLDALSHREDWRGELLICVAYEDASGKRYHCVPRRQALHQELKPVYESFDGWSEDISSIRTFADLPENAKRYVAAMLGTMLDAAYHPEPPQSMAPELPNLRYLGVGPEPSQIIKDVPPVETLLEKYYRPARTTA